GSLPLPLLRRRLRVHGDLRQARLRRGRRRRRAAGRALRPGRRGAGRGGARRGAGAEARTPRGRRRAAHGRRGLRDAGRAVLPRARADGRVAAVAAALHVPGARDRRGDRHRARDRDDVPPRRAGRRQRRHRARAARRRAGRARRAGDRAGARRLGRVHGLHPVRRPHRRGRAAGGAGVARDRGSDRHVRDRAAGDDGSVARLRGGGLAVGHGDRAGLDRRGDPRVLRRPGARRAVERRDPLDARAAGHDRPRRARARRGAQPGAAPRRRAHPRDRDRAELVVGQSSPRAVRM
ncbi:MAG: Permease of the drug/metabolite transporter (DMT) superfamily, partial [uncultured Solirubrobacteraceae bacterium]